MVFQQVYQIKRFTIRNAQCACLDLCKNTPTCVATYIVYDVNATTCNGLSSVGAAIDSSSNSESWSFVSLTTPQPTTDFSICVAPTNAQRSLSSSMKNGGSRFSNGNDIGSRVFQTAYILASFTASHAQCLCLDLCANSSLCVGVYIAYESKSTVCNGLSVLGPAIDTIGTSESWTVTPITTTTTVAPVVCPPNAVQEFASVAGTGGFRFKNALSPSAAVFSARASRVNITLSDFRCQCLAQCQTSAGLGCTAVYVNIGSAHLVCHGLSNPGPAVSSTHLTSESWSLAPVVEPLCVTSQYASLTFNATSLSTPRLRFMNVFIPEQKVFHTRVDRSKVTLNAFRCQCFSACQLAQQACVAVFVDTAPHAYTCTGLTFIGPAVHTLTNSESWTMNTQ